MSTTSEPLPELRTRIRRLRRQVTGAEACRAAEGVASGLMRLPEVSSARCLAVYLVDDGEVDPAPAVEEFRRRGASVYAPIVSGPKMAFAELDGATRTNDFGIEEPFGNPVEISVIDVVIAPLVAVDRHGTRIGRGRGYYDRALAHLLDSPRPARPFVVGVAHDFQVVEALERGERDVPVDAVVTPTEVLRVTG